MIKIIKKIKKKGFIKPIVDFINYRIKPKVKKIVIKIFSSFFSSLKIQDMIIFSSHNDFDMNSGTLYDYMIKNNYNEKYKLVWFVKHIQKTDLPDNVYQVKRTGINLKRYYYNAVAKYIFYDDIIIYKWKIEQVSVYLGHATRAMKNCRGLVSQPESLDYLCSSSEDNDELMADVYCSDIKKMIHVGFPVTDLLHKKWKELDKLNVTKQYNKIIVWMPTFRKIKDAKYRNDSKLESDTGLALIENADDYKRLNDYLLQKNTLLIIKFHPMQDMRQISVKSMSNILLLSADDIKNLSINTYKLLTQTDALISDYSSISFDYLLLDKPISYMLSDFDDYKLGFAVENPKEYMPGDYIYNIDDFNLFIDNVINGIDENIDKRKKVRDKVAKYNDGNCCAKICEFFKL